MIESEVVSRHHRQEEEDSTASELGAGGLLSASRGLAS